jgi:hypothetical protein
MRVFVDLNSSTFVVSPVLTQRVSTLFFVRRDNVPVEVQFVRGGTVVELGAGATGSVGLKKTFSGSFLASDTSWTKSGTGSSTVYQFDLNLNTVAMDGEFTNDNSTASIDAKIEISWTVSSTTSSTMPCVATVYNDVIRGTEGAPSSANTQASFLLTSPDASIWSVSIDNNGVLTTTPQ